jgi:RNA recognition motif-containing protein
LQRTDEKFENLYKRWAPPCAEGVTLQPTVEKFENLYKRWAPSYARAGIVAAKATRLFVGNLPHSITDSALNDFAVNAGLRVNSVVVIRDRMTGESRGFGFIELAEGEDVARAIQELNSQTLGGRKLTVNEPSPPRTGFSSQVPGRKSEPRPRARPLKSKL